MESYQLVTYVMLPFIGVSAYLVLRHLSMWALGRRERLHLWVAGWCAGALTFQLGRLVQQQSSDPALAHVAYLVYHGAVFIQFAFLNLISYDLDGTGRQRGLLRAMVLGNLFMTILFVATPLCLEHRMYLRVDMLGVRYWEMQPAALYWLVMLVWALANFLHVFLTVWFARRLDARVRRTILGSYIVYLVFGMNDLHFLGGMINTTSVFAFGFLTIAVAFDHMMILRLNILQNHLEDEVQQRTRELTVATQEARAATAAKSEFLANMSHEIRTPMTAIIGFAESLAEPNLAEHERQEMIATIRRNGEHLLSVINDILDLSKIESGRLEPEYADCDPEEIIAIVDSLMRPRAHAKGLTFDVTHDSSLPRAVRTDPTRVRQSLLNLVSNAIKFTDEGRVTLRARFETDRQMLVFSVTDTGIGIPPDRLEAIFAPFRQADTSTTRRFGGTGLGLTITRRFAELLGGSVRVQSKPRRGTTFTLEIAAPPGETPVALRTPADELPHDAAGATPLVGARLLLVEDGPDNQRLIVHILKKAGAAVVTAANGREGVTHALAAVDADQPFDVILMDMQMPVLDGYAATRELRRHNYPGPIIALTAHAMKDDRARCLAAGCDDFASKPVRRRELIRLIAGYLPRAESCSIRIPSALSATPPSPAGCIDTHPA